MVTQGLSNPLGLILILVRAVLVVARVSLPIIIASSG